MWQQTFLRPCLEPVAYALSFGFCGIEGLNCRRRPVEGGNRRLSLFHNPVHIRHVWPQEPVRFHPDLMRGPIVDPQRRGTSPNINAQGLPRERLLEYPLPQVTGKEETVTRI